LGRERREDGGEMGRSFDFRALAVLEGMSLQKRKMKESYVMNEKEKFG
jgi:hypothetical protein